MQQHLLAAAQIYRAYMSIVLTLECGGEEKKKKKHTLAIQSNSISHKQLQTKNTFYAW